MDVIIGLTGSWEKGNYLCTRSQYDFLSDARIRVDHLPGFSKLIVAVPSEDEKVNPVRELAIDISHCELEVFPEDANGCRSFSVLKVPPVAVTLR